eukprot:Gb_26540 [translate_table: standard]
MLENLYKIFLFSRKTLEQAINREVADLNVSLMYTFLGEWNLRTNDLQDPFWNVSNILKDNIRSSKTHPFLLKVLTTFFSEDAYTIYEKEDVRFTIFVKAPDIFQCHP